MKPTPDLDRLLKKASQGDCRAWERLVDEFGSLVYSIARKCGLSEEDAADVHQFTFLRLYQSLGRIENPATLPKWLAVTCSREAWRVKRTSDRYVHEADLPEHARLDEQLADDGVRAEAVAEEGHHAQLSRQAMQELPERCRSLLTLLYQETPATYAEVSKNLNLPTGAIGPTKARCLEKLRRTLEKMGFFYE